MKAQVGNIIFWKSAPALLIRKTPKGFAGIELVTYRSFNIRNEKIKCRQVTIPKEALKQELYPILVRAQRPRDREDLKAMIRKAK